MEEKEKLPEKGEPEGLEEAGNNFFNINFHLLHFSNLNHR